MLKYRFVSIVLIQGLIHFMSLVRDFSAGNIR